MFDVRSGAGLTLQSVSVTGGGSVSSGAGIRVTGSNSALVVRAAHVIGNATSANGTGGGIAAEVGTSVLIEQGSTVGANSALHGGGIDVANATLTVRDSAISDNGLPPFGDGEGAGIRLANATMIAENALIDLNHDAKEGGGIAAFDSDLTLTRSDLGGAAGNQALVGGGVYLLGGSATITGTSIRNNTAAGGGGLYLVTSATAQLTASSVHDNSGTDSFAGAYANQSTLQLTNTTVSNNSALVGGGIGLENQAELITEHATIADNTASISAAALYVSNDPSHSLTWRNTIIQGDCVQQATGTLTVAVVSQGGNVESPGDTCGLGAGVNDLSPTSGFFLHLIALADNGGPTLSHALGSRSVARNNAVCTGACLTNDQRFFSRGPDPVDSGSIEYGTLFQDSFESP